MLLTLFGDVDQVPDLARSALALIFRIVPTNTHIRVSWWFSGWSDDGMDSGAPTVRQGNVPIPDFFNILVQRTGCLVFDDRHLVVEKRETCASP